jgi:hypothetical protein
MMNNSQHHRVVIALREAQHMAEHTLWNSPDAIDGAAHMAHLCACMLWDQLTLAQQRQVSQTDNTTIRPPATNGPPDDAELYRQAKYLTHYLWKGAATRRDMLRGEKVTA